MPVVPKLGVPVLPIVSVIDCASIGVLVGVKPPGGGRRGEYQMKRERGREKRGGEREEATCLGRHLSFLASLSRRAARCFSSSLNFSAAASSTFPSSSSRWSGRYRESVGHVTTEGEEERGK